MRAAPQSGDGRSVRAVVVECRDGSAVVPPSLSTPKLAGARSPIKSDRSILDTPKAVGVSRTTLYRHLTAAAVG